MACPFCATPIVATAQCRKQIKPNAVLPFAISRQHATDAFRQWVRSRWFAPSALKRQSFVDAPIRGVYLPYWTYDMRATTAYTGQRGDHYYVPVVRNVVVNGKARAMTTMERRTRWSSASGVVRNAFDDVLVPASSTLPDDKAQALEPWDLPEMCAYQDAYLSGFVSESYQLGLPEGFARAGQRVRPAIEQTVRGDIGGDVQRIASMQVRYDHVTFKHCLLPVWISAYRFRNTVYRFFVNARTGEVAGERPWSYWKIAGFVLLILALIGAIVGIVAIARG
jgi:hypothetical protein